MPSSRVARARANVVGHMQAVPLAPKTTSGSSDPIQSWNAGSVSHASMPRAQLKITAVSGTSPTLNVSIQDSPDGVTWTTRDSFPQQNSITTIARNLPKTLAQYQRVLWTIGGTNPSFTFDVQIAARQDQLL